MIYCLASGETHLLDSLAPELLACLREQPQSATSLAEKLAHTFDPADWGELSAFIDSLLLQLQDIGLVTGLPA